MCSPYRAIPEYSRIRLLVRRRRTSRDFMSAVPGFVALRVIRCPLSCKRNVVHGSDRAGIPFLQTRCGTHVAIGAARALRLSNPSMPFSGEA